jgi:UTP--glucose-1-phosphate uridylyltransferase
MQLNKVVFPVAGHGSRFLPATKATPKEMLPVVDKPLIQYAVEEAIDAGFTELIFITGKTKRGIEDHFDASLNLNVSNITESKKKLFDKMNCIIPSHISCTYIDQEEPLGLGHAILQAKPIIGNEPFAVILADDLIDSKKGVIKQMVEQYVDMNSSIISVQHIEKKDSIHYGMIDTDISDENMRKITGIVEKPSPANSPSSFGVVGRYIFSNQILSFIETIGFGTGNEIQLTDAIKKMIATQPVFAYEFEGTRYDCGDKLGYIKANIEYALKDKKFGTELLTYLKEKVL